MENRVQEKQKLITGDIKINEKSVTNHIDGLVHQSVEVLPDAGRMLFAMPPSISEIQNRHYQQDIL